MADRREETERAQFELERSEIADYGGPVDWPAEINRVIEAVNEFGPYTQLWIRRTTNARKFAADLRSMLPPEVSQRVTFLVAKPFEPFEPLPIGKPGDPLKPGAFDLHWEYDHPPR